MAKRIKNTTDAPILHINSGISFPSLEYLEIQPINVSLVCDDQIFNLLSNGQFIFNDGSQDFTSPSDGWSALNGEIKPGFQVTTQFELNNKDLKLACGSAFVGEDGVATIDIPIPGSYADGNGRYIAGGTAFFDVQMAGDKITEVCVIDKDNILGAGENFIVKSYSDTEQNNIENQGWFIPVKFGEVYVEPIGGYGFIPAQLYLRIIAKKGGGITTGTFYINVFWGKME